MSTALYRRYRPDSFAEVIGQEHVTAPLMQAIRSNRVNHAYLFSGPRGCGKTTSARILARILNCAKNTPASPSAVPCEDCDSCRDLARGGPGSLDVVEIDAASHGGVDDARELRERATFSPSRDRFKIFILDEAHMVTPQGFNALLKIVEEPPEYLKFIFATTEPDKVIGTIRSRTHHYPFRLVPAEVLSPYLEQLCSAEGVRVGAGVLPLVVRAGGGSVRDSLSVMDQLIAGSSSGEVDYELAVALLGYTHATLLDDVVEALAARDGASIFRVIERVIDTGHEPRRFVEDLLERLRDLIVIAVSGENAAAVLRDVPADQLDRMRTQANNLGAAELSRAADLVNAALTEMSGATSPRLHLELLCARLLLPGADDGAQGYAARLDRLERGLGSAPVGVGTVSPAAAPVAAPAPAPVPVARVSTPPVSAQPVSAPASRPAAEPVAPQVPAIPAERETSTETPTATPAAVSTTTPPPWDVPESGPDEPVAGRSVTDEPAADRANEAPAQPEPAQPAPAPAPAPAAVAAGPSEGSGDLDTEVLRRRWPEVLDTISRLRKATWALVSQNAQVVDLTETTLRLAFSSSGLATTFRNGPHAELVQQAVHETLGFKVRVEGTIIEEGASAGGAVAPAQPVALAPAPVPSPVQPAPAPLPAPEPVPSAEPVPEVAEPQARAPEQAPQQENATWGQPQPTEPVDQAPARVIPAAEVTWEVVPVGGGSGVSSPAPTEPAVSGHVLPPSGPITAQSASVPASVPTPSAASVPSASSLPTPGSPSGVAEQDQAVPARTESRREAVERKVAESRAALAQQRESEPPPYDDVPPYEEEPPYDDPDSVPITESALVGAPLVAKILGGQVIDEIVDEP